MRRMYSEKQLEDIANARVKALVEGGTLNNAKPIYWHGIALYKNDEAAIIHYLTCHVLNNTDTPFTLTSFVEWAESISGEVTVECSGFVTYGSTAYQMVALRKKANNEWIALYNNGQKLATTGIEIGQGQDLDTIDDDVNKIN